MIRHNEVYVQCLTILAVLSVLEHLFLGEEKMSEKLFLGCCFSGVTLPCGYFELLVAGIAPRKLGNLYVLLLAQVMVETEPGA